MTSDFVRLLLRLFSHLIVRLAEGKRFLVMRRSRLTVFGVCCVPTHQVLTAGTALIVRHVQVPRCLQHGYLVLSTMIVLVLIRFGVGARVACLNAVNLGIHAADA